MEHLTLAERLAALRKQAKLSQAEVAAKLSLSRQAVSKWESGKGLPSLIAYSVLASLYGISVDVILSGKEADEDQTLPKLNSQHFHEALREARRNRKISQESLAKSLSVSRQSVSKWESGKAEPDAEHLIALANFLKVSLSQLLPSADAQPAQAKQPLSPKTPAPKKEKNVPTEKPVEKQVEKPVQIPKAPEVPVQPKTPAPQPKVQPKAASKPAPEPVSRRQLLQERVRLAGQKERAAKAALSKSGVKKK